MKYSYIRNIARENQHFYGWGYIIKQYANKTKLYSDGVVLDTWVDQENNSAQLDLLTKHKWVGILHATPKPPSDKSGYCIDRFINSDNFKFSRDNCKLLITTSEHSKRYLNSIIDLPVQVLIHPKPDTGIYFDLDYYITKPRIRHSGFHVRNIEKFLNFKTSLDKIIYSDREIRNNVYFNALKNNKNKVFFKSQYLKNQDYIDLLTKSIGFSFFDDCSASNSILEHIMTHTPLIVNRINPIEEYLGKDYPMYIDCICDDYDKFLYDKYFLHDVSMYLKALSQRRVFSLDYFNNFLNTLVI